MTDSSLGRQVRSRAARNSGRRGRKAGVETLESRIMLSSYFVSTGGRRRQRGLVLGAAAHDPARRQPRRAGRHCLYPRRHLPRDGAARAVRRGRRPHHLQGLQQRAGHRQRAGASSAGGAFNGNVYQTDGRVLGPGRRQEPGLRGRQDDERGALAQHHAGRDAQLR